MFRNWYRLSKCCFHYCWWWITYIMCNINRYRCAFYAFTALCSLLSSQVNNIKFICTILCSMDVFVTITVYKDHTLLCFECCNITRWTEISILFVFVLYIADTNVNMYYIMYYALVCIAFLTISDHKKWMFCTVHSYTI